MPILSVGLVVAVAVVVWVVLGRRAEQFHVSIRGDRMFVRGSCPDGLVADFEDIFERAGVTSGSLTAYRGDGSLRLVTDGLSDGGRSKVPKRDGLLHGARLGRRQRQLRAPGRTGPSVARLRVAPSPDHPLVADYIR